MISYTVEGGKKAMVGGNHGRVNLQTTSVMTSVASHAIQFDAASFSLQLQLASQSHADPRTMETSISRPP